MLSGPQVDKPPGKQTSTQHNNRQGAPKGGKEPEGTHRLGKLSKNENNYVHSRDLDSNMTDDFDILKFLDHDSMTENEIQCCSFWVKANARVRKSGVPNFAKEKIAINDKWDFDYLEEELKNDKEALDTIQKCRYGWPLNAINTEIDNKEVRNQKGANQNISKLDRYLKKELARGSIIGPFKNHHSDLIRVRISPLDMRPKKDSDDVHIILNLSYPRERGS